MEFSCSECGYRSERKFHIKTHIEKENRCGPNPQIVEIPGIIECEHCGRTFKTNPSLKRHYKMCKVKKEKDSPMIPLPTLEFNETCANFIYMLMEREFIKSGESVFKIGFTARDIFARGNGYPKGSKIYCCMPVANNPENNLIREFKKQFKHRPDIGNEYFEGKFRDMVICLYKSIYCFI